MHPVGIRSTAFSSAVSDFRCCTSKIDFYKKTIAVLISGCCREKDKERKKAMKREN